MFKPKSPPEVAQPADIISIVFRILLQQSLPPRLQKSFLEERSLQNIKFNSMEKIGWGEMREEKREGERDEGDKREPVYCCDSLEAVGGCVGSQDTLTLAQLCLVQGVGVLASVLPHVRPQGVTPLTKPAFKPHTHIQSINTIIQSNQKDNFSNRGSSMSKCSRARH